MLFNPKNMQKEVYGEEKNKQVTVRCDGTHMLTMTVVTRGNAVTQITESSFYSSVWRDKREVWRLTDLTYVCSSAFHRAGRNNTMRDIFAKEAYIFASGSPGELGKPARVSVRRAHGDIASEIAKRSTLFPTPILKSLHSKMYLKKLS